MDWNSVSGCLNNGVPTLDCIPHVFNLVVTAALVFAGIIALFFIILAGIRMITSGGDAKQLEAARKTLTFAIMGLVIILMSFLIINIIAYVTRNDCIKSVNIRGC